MPKFLRSEKIDWMKLFKEAEIKPQQAKLAKSATFGEWFLDIGDDVMRCVTPPKTNGTEMVKIENNQWVIYDS